MGAPVINTLLARRNVYFPGSSFKLLCKNYHSPRFFGDWSLARHTGEKYLLPLRLHALDTGGNLSYSLTELV